MRHLIRKRDFGDYGDKSMIKRLEKGPRMKEGLDSVEHISFNNLPILLIKESKESIRAGSFVRT